MIEVRFEPDPPVKSRISGVSTVSLSIAPYLLNWRHSNIFGLGSDTDEYQNIRGVPTEVTRSSLSQLNKSGVSWKH